MKKHAALTAMVMMFGFLFCGCATVRLPDVEIGKQEPAEALEWKKIAEETLKSNPDLKSAKYEIDSAARSRDIAAGDYLPSATGELGRSSSQASGITLNNTNIGLTAQQSFFNGFTTTGQVIGAEKTLEATRFNYEVTSANVRFRLRQAFVQLLKLERLIEVTRGIETRRKQNAEMIQLRYEAGRENLGSSLRAGAIAEQAALDVRIANRQVESQAIRLQREIGSVFKTKIRAGGLLEKMLPGIPQEDPDYPALANQVPNVKQAIKTAESYKAAIITAQGALWPQVNGTAQIGSSGETRSKLGKETFLGIAVAMPFFNGGKNISAIRKAKADYEAARENARSIRDETIAQLADAWVSFLNAVEQVKVSEQFLIAGRKRAEIIRVEYETGLMNFQDFDITEQDYANAEIAYVQSLAEALIKQANWELAKGTTLEEALHET